MVNYADAFSQSESGKYFERIIIQINESERSSRRQRGKFAFSKVCIFKLKNFDFCLTEEKLFYSIAPLHLKLLLRKLVVGFGSVR